MIRTALIAAALSIIPLTVAAPTTQADPFHRGGGYGRHAGPPPPVYHGYGGYRRHYDHPRRHHWRPMPPWRRWNYWR